MYNFELSCLWLSGLLVRKQSFSSCLVLSAAESNSNHFMNIPWILEWNWADVCFSRASLHLYIFASVISIFCIEIKSIYDCTKIELVKKKKNAATPDKLNWIFDRSEDGCRQMRTDWRCKTKTIIWSTDTQQQSAPEGERMLPWARSASPSVMFRQLLSFSTAPPDASAEPAAALRHRTSVSVFTRALLAKCWLSLP